MPDFAGKVAIVTGAAGGLGLAIAERLASDGAAVVLADIDLKGAEVARETVARRGARALAQRTDVSDRNDVAALVERTLAELGRLDIMISNAGIGGTHPFLDEPFEHWNRVLAVNLTGVFLCGQAAARAMVKQKAGRIVNIASISGVRAGSGRTAYGTAKAGVIQLTKQMALELGPLGINVNAIAPGPVETALTLRDHTAETRAAYNALVPLERYGAPQEIAAAVAFLSSQEASYINGQTLCVDGGFTAAGMIARDVVPRAGD